MTWSVTINGHTYTDTMMAGFGYLTHWPTMLEDVAAVGSDATSDAAAAAASASAASTYAAALSGTSSTSTLIGTGSKSFTASTGKQWQVGQYVYVARSAAPTIYMAGQVTAYNSGTGALTVDVQATNGSGTYTDWVITIGGARGETGSVIDITTTSKSGSYTAVSGDKGTILECTGTWTLALTAAATLGSGWWVWVRNTGTGTITIDPNSAETIDGATTATLKGGSWALVQCDGSAFRCVARSPVRRAILDSASASVNAVSGGDGLPFANVDHGLSGVTGVVTYGNSLFLVASSASKSNVSTSPDGTTWTLRAMPSSAVWLPASNGTNKFLASVSGATTIAVSTDGTTWSSGTALGGTAGAQGPVYNGNSVAVRGSSTTTLYTSTDNGATWGTQTLPAALNGSSLSAVGGVWWYWTSGTTAYTSSTGATGSWTSRTLPFTPPSGAKWHGYTTSGDLVIWSPGGVPYESSDGINWTAQTDPIAPFVTFGEIGWVKVNSVALSLCGFDGSGTAAAATLHNGSWISRGGVYITNGLRRDYWATDGTYLVLCQSASATAPLLVMTIANATALFDA